MDLTFCYGAESQTNKMLNPHTILIKLGLYIKHCQRHNRPEDRVWLTIVTYFSHITSSNTKFDQISSSEY